MSGRASPQREIASLTPLSEYLTSEVISEEVPARTTLNDKIHHDVPVGKVPDILFGQ